MLKRRARGFTIVELMVSLARAEAVRLNALVRFQAQAGGWRITRVDTGVDLHQASGREGPAALTLTWSPAGTSAVTFDAFGRVADPRFDVGMSFVTLDVASASLPDWKPLRLQIQSSGLARLCDPAATGSDPRTCL